MNTGIEDLRRYVDRCIEGAHALGQPNAALAGLKHFFVEQGGNFTHDPIRSITDSAEHVKRVLLKDGAQRSR